MNIKQTINPSTDFEQFRIRSFHEKELLNIATGKYQRYLRTYKIVLEYCDQVFDQITDDYDWELRHELDCEFEVSDFELDTKYHTVKFFPREHVQCLLDVLTKSIIIQYIKRKIERDLENDAMTFSVNDVILDCISKEFKYNKQLFINCCIGDRLNASV